MVAVRLVCPFSIESVLSLIPSAETIRPEIYLPFSLDGQELSYVIAHEQAHIRRRDHWWKPLGFLLLAVHWFNPLMWAAYMFLCRDIELACDEKVIKELGREQRADYSQALLNSSVKRAMITACPLAFGEVGVKMRVKNVLNDKKPAFWMVAAAVVVCAALGVCFLTDPVERAEAASVETDQDRRDDLSWGDLAEQCQRKALDVITESGSFEDEMDALFKMIMSSPVTSSNSYDYIRAHPERE